MNKLNLWVHSDIASVLPSSTAVGAMRNLRRLHTIIVQEYWHFIRSFCSRRYGVKLLFYLGTILKQSRLRSMERNLHLPNNLHVVRILLELRWQLVCPHVVFKSAFVLARAPLWGTWDRFFSWNRCGFLCQFGEAMRFMLDNAVRVEYLAVRKL